MQEMVLQVLIWKTALQEVSHPAEELIGRGLRGQGEVNAGLPLARHQMIRRAEGGLGLPQTHRGFDNHQGWFIGCPGCLLAKLLKRVCLEVEDGAKLRQAVVRAPSSPLVPIQSALGAFFGLLLVFEDVTRRGHRKRAFVRTQPVTDADEAGELDYPSPRGRRQVCQASRLDLEALGQLLGRRQSQLGPERATVAIRAGVLAQVQERTVVGGH